MTPGYAARVRRLQCAFRRVGLVIALLVVATMSLSWGPAATAAPAAPTGAREQRTVLVIGDSLSAAYGLAAEQGWVSMIRRKIEQERPGWRVVNASVSGETTAGGAARIVDAVARHRPDVVVIALGANDGLRGLPPRQMRINLARMIGAAHGAGAEVLLVGMRMPPNLGAAYTREFEQSYRDLAERFDTALLPFLLEPIALDRASYQGDNLHPNAAAQPKLRDHVWQALEPLLR
ncbi:MAG: arylesterase [Pseudomonadota bacterium]|nr:arylesterase [Pseudomonadota bacterium]